MKKALIFLLSIISITGFSQGLLPNPSGNTPAMINAALGGSIAASGTDTYTGSLTGLTTYAGFACDIQFANANTGAATLNITGATVLGAKTLKKYSSGSLVDLAAGDIQAGSRIRFYYNGTYLVMMGVTVPGGSGSVTTTAPLTGTSTIGITQSNTSTDGYLSSTDWNTFNGKQAALVSATNIKTVNGTSLLGSTDISTDATSFTASTSQASGRNLLSSDNGKTIYCTNSSPITITIPTGLTQGFHCKVLQSSTGAVVVSGAGGTTVIGNGTTTNAGDFILVEYFKSSETYVIQLVNGSTGSGGTVTSVSGTANQIASTGGTTPVLSIVTNPILPGAPTIVSPGNSTQNIITTDATQTLSNKTLVAPALGTPASGVGTNITGIVGTNVINTPSGNIAATTSQAAINELDTEKAPLYPTTNRQTSSYTFALTDVGKTVEMNSASANTLTIPDNSTVAFPLYTQLVGAQYGVGQTSIVAGGSVTFRNASGVLTFPSQYSFVYAYKIGTNEWYLVNSVYPPSTTTLTGTTTNDNAVAGNLGEYSSSLVASGSAVSLTTATTANITSISLTAGDWDVEGNINFTETSSTVTARSGGVSSTSATVPTDGSEAYNGGQTTTTSQVNSITLPRKRISLTVTTTIYLVAKVTFSAGTCAGFGTITARRAR